MATSKPSLAWLSTTLRGLIWLVVISVITLLFFWKPLILFLIGLLLALVLVASFIVGGLFWEGDSKPTSAVPSTLPRE